MGKGSAAGSDGAGGAGGQKAEGSGGQLKRGIRVRLQCGTARVQSWQT